MADEASVRTSTNDDGYEERIEQGTGAGRLRAGSIGTTQVLIMSLAFAGPTVSIFFNSAPAVGNSGAALPLAFVVAAIGAVFVANSVIQFAKKLPTASFAYTFNANGLGPRWGHLSGWLLLLGYALTTPMLYAATALWSSQLVQDLTGLHISWHWFFLLCLAGTVALSHWGIQQTTKLSLTLVAFEVAVVVALSLTILVRGGDSGLSATPFSPSAPGASWSGIFLAMVFTVMSFVGFENTAVLGEESRNPRRVIPRATLAAIVVLGAYYIFTSYAEVIGFGTNNMDQMGKFDIPFNGLAQRYWGHGASYLVGFAAVTALFAGVIASHNATTRVLYSMGRTGALPRALGRTHPVHATPTVANATHAVFALVVGGGVGLWVGPGNVWAYLGSFMVPAIIIVYLLVNVSVYRYYRRQHPNEFSWVKHALFPLLGTAAMVLPLKSVVWPVPPMPYRLAPYIVGLWIVIGVVWMAVLKRRRPEALNAAADIWSAD
ncbi:MAG: family permease [Dactylosporangium sp.]|nr:family permease [Dactylosporangium sp.]